MGSDFTTYLGTHWSDKKMKKRTWLWILLGSLFGFLMIFAFIYCFALIALKSASRHYTQGDIALVHIEGVITSGKSGLPFMGGTGAGAESLLKTLDRISRSPHFKAIVIRINSPGGTAAGAQEVYEKLMNVRRNTGKKVVVSMGDVAASGGYYIASAADKIVAERATLTGSIGVIAELVDLQGLFKKIGVRPETLKAGRLKDLGSQTRPLTPEEKKLFQDILNETHDDFISDVAKGRKLPEDYVRKLADGRVYTGKQALQLHLVDSLGGLEDAQALAAKMVGLAGSFKVVDVDRRTFLEQFIGETNASESIYPGWSIFQGFRKNFPPGSILFLMNPPLHLRV